MQDLVGSSSSDRNWKGIAIAIGVILLVLCGVALSVKLMTPPDSGPRVKGLRFSIKHILDYKFNPRKFNGTWVSGITNNKLFRCFKIAIWVFLMVFIQIIGFRQRITIFWHIWRSINLQCRDIWNYSNRRQHSFCEYLLSILTLQVGEIVGCDFSLFSNDLN